MILLIDNYDSFSYNLYQMIGAIDPDIRVIRNDEMSADEIRALSPEHIILSPGPGRPEHAGVTMDVVRELDKEIPILGVCLGHQAICAVYGADITYAPELMHGRQSVVSFAEDCRLFEGCGKEGAVARYHSLTADPNTMPDELLVTATTKDGQVMAVRHRKYPVYGVQFHPESILTPNGRRMLENFMLIRGQRSEVRGQRSEVRG